MTIQELIKALADLGIQVGMDTPVYVWSPDDGVPFGEYVTTFVEAEGTDCDGVTLHIDKH